jgi:hypothetical protein
MLVYIICSCNESNTKNTNNNELSLKDSLFVFKGISSTEIVEKSVWDFEQLYVDSTEKRTYIKLDNKQKLRLLPNILKMDTLWIRMDIQAYFISKQEKIGNIQPIIIQTSGTDFAALLLINLDNKGNLLSGMILTGGENSSPQGELDSLLFLRPYTRCFFNKNHIKSYTLSAMVEKNRNNKLAIIDSVNYESVIESNGTIKTKKLDSFRYKRNYYW